MVNTIRRQPNACEVLVVTDHSRLGRNLASLAPVFSMLQYRDIPIHSVSLGRTVYLFGVAQRERCNGVQQT